MADSTNPKVQKATVIEEDLDDLDDVLDQFSSEKASTTPEATSGRPRTNTRVDVPPPSLPGAPAPTLGSTAEVNEDELASEFAKELAKGMESLMKEIAGDAGVDVPTGDGDDAQARAFKAAWEAMLVEGLNETGGAEAPSSSTAEKLESDENFQDKIKKAMEKLKEGDEKAPGSAPSADSIESLLKSLGDLGLDGGENDGELAGLLESMMGQLMSKEILYEPLKELADGFPPYLANPPNPLSSEDREKYEKQLECVKKILAVFDQPSYTDTDAESQKKIVELMSEMQSHGSPPSEIMGPLPPGFDGTGFPNLEGGDENCTIA